jgi:hypothetical protein
MERRLFVESLERRLAPATFLVSNANDAGTGSLRQAILAANAAAGPDTVAFDATFFATPRTIALSSASGQLVITDDLDVIGPGTGRLTVTGNTFTRVFYIGNGATPAIAVSLAGLTVTGGNGSNGGPAPSFGEGGGIYVENEFLTLTDVVLTANTTANQFFHGGGIQMAAGRLDLFGCTVSGNTAGIGGGISFEGTGLTVQGSTISGNVATTNSASGGGGIYFDGGSQGIGFTLRNSTVAGNTSASNGGGIMLGVASSTIPLVIQNSTITGNTANGQNLGGGGICLIVSPNGPAVVNVQSSIVSGNTASAASGRSDIAITAGATVTANFSAIGDPDGFTLSGTSGNNLPFGTALNLRPLGNYGGPTATCALADGSPAVDVGSNPAGLATDQRGAGFPRVLGGVADIGAFEGTIDVPVATGGPFANVTTAGLTYTFDVVYNGTTPINVSTLDNNDVRITGPGGFNQLATFLTVTPAGNGSPRTATYRITGPGGSFGGEDNGTYTIAVQAGQVANTNGFTNLATTLGTFNVVVSTTYTVTNLSHTGTGSLQQAILNSNASPGLADIIVFQPGLSGIIHLASTLTITDSVTIVGPGTISVSGEEAIRVFAISDGTPAAISVAISGLTIYDGRSPANARGAGIYFDNEALTLDRVVVRNNATFGTNAGGGGIAGIAGGSLTIRDSTVSNNGASTVPSRGGGIAVYSGTLVVERCTISGNAAGTVGGGLYLSSAFGTGVTIRNSTITGNSAPSGGGIAVGFAAAGTPIVVQNCTITGNPASSFSTADGTGGGGLVVTSLNALSVSVVSSVVSGNTANNGRADLSVPSPTVVNVNFSAVGVANGFTPSGTSGNNLPFGAVLGLGTLANNGGPTQTIAFAVNSPLRNAGANPAILTTDQRGAGFVRVAGPTADIGAFEFQTAAPPQVTSAIVNGGQANLTQRSRVTSLTVTFSAQVAFAGAVGSAFTLSRNGGGTVNFSATASVIGGVTIVTLTSFTGSETQFGSLRDGRYTLTAIASQISAGGVALDGNGDGKPGDDYTFGDAQGLFRFFGDINGDRNVDIADFGLFSSTYGLSFGQAGFIGAFDFNGDGVIDIADFGQFSIRIFTVLP